MNTDFLTQGRKDAEDKIGIYGVVSGGSKTSYQQDAENSNICLRAGSADICLAGQSYASSSGNAPGHRCSHCSRTPSLVNRKMDGTAPTLIMYPAKSIRMTIAAFFTLARFSMNGI